MPTKKAAIATPLSPQERYGYSRHDARSPGKATEGSGSGLVEGSVFSDVGPPSGPSSPSRSVTFPVGDKDAHHAAAGESHVMAKATHALIRRKGCSGSGQIFFGFLRWRKQPKF